MMKELQSKLESVMQESNQQIKKMNAQYDTLLSEKEAAIKYAYISVVLYY